MSSEGRTMSETGPDEVRWLYPTATARSAHAFLGSRPSTNPNADRDGQDDVALGIQSLCRKYDRSLGDMGWQTQDGTPPVDACAPCKRKAEKR